jgi:HEAT repeat protein
VPAIARALEDNNVEVRIGAAFNFGFVIGGPIYPGEEAEAESQAKIAVPALVKALKDQSDSVQGLAVMALSNIGPPARRAVPALLELVKHKDPGMRSVAADALGKIAPRERAVVKALLNALNDPKDEVRRSAHRGVVYGGPEAVPELIQMFRQPNPRRRERAAYALAVMGPAAREALPELRKAAMDQDLKVRLVAIMALGDIGRKGEAFGTLLEALADPKKAVREAAGFSLAKNMEATIEAMPEVVKALKHEQPHVRRVAAALLAQTGMWAYPALADLRLAQKDKNRLVRETAVAAVQTIEKQFKEQLPGAIEGLKDKDPQNRESCAMWLGRLGPAAKAAVPELRAALDDPNSQVRAAAASALKKIDP